VLRLEAGATATRDADDTQWLQGPPTWGWRLGATRDAIITTGNVLLNSVPGTNNE